jgi:hypothetical protein
MDYCIAMPYATYHIAITNGNVSEAPPIAKWMIGKGIVEPKLRAQSSDFRRGLSSDLISPDKNITL